jgi:hypothetical protein
MNDVSDRVRAVLRTAGAARSRELQEATGASQATISRALAPMLRSGEVLRVGKARNQAYVMPRAVSGIASPTIPVMAVARDGSVRSFGTLIPCAGGRYWMDENDAGAKLHDGLPWFIADMRPQGFLGRSFAHAHSALGLAANPDHWTDDDVLRGLCHVGDDLPGNLLVGSASFERYMHAKPQPRVKPARYAAMAEAAMQGALPGSSAGGEQPKFCAVRDDGQAVIVKFSPAGRTAVDQRWSDLLRCEHIALQTLRDSAVEAADTRIFTGGDRTLLEVLRFDRTARGRVGMVSLLSYDSEFVGQIDNWAATAARMAARGLLTEGDARTLCFLEAFGRLIANTDRHYGNVSLLIEEGSSWRLAPAYDMLPMMYAPVGGELVAREFDAGSLAPTAETLGVWEAARVAARTFWLAASADEGISKGFRKIAAAHARELKGDARPRRPASDEPPFSRVLPS